MSRRSEKNKKRLGVEQREKKLSFEDWQAKVRSITPSEAHLHEPLIKTGEGWLPWENMTADQQRDYVEHLQIEAAYVGHLQDAIEKLTPLGTWCNAKEVQKKMWDLIGEDEPKINPNIKETKEFIVNNWDDFIEYMQCYDSLREAFTKTDSSEGGQFDEVLINKVLTNSEWKGAKGLVSVYIKFYNERYLNCKIFNDQYNDLYFRGKAIRFDNNFFTPEGVEKRLQLVDFIEDTPKQLKKEIKLTDYEHPSHLWCTKALAYRMKLGQRIRFEGAHLPLNLAKKRLGEYGSVLFYLRDYCLTEDEGESEYFPRCYLSNPGGGGTILYYAEDVKRLQRTIKRGDIYTVEEIQCKQAEAYKESISYLTHLEIRSHDDEEQWLRMAQTFCYKPPAMTKAAWMSFLYLEVEDIGIYQTSGIRLFRLKSLKFQIEHSLQDYYQEVIT